MSIFDRINSEKHNKEILSISNEMIAFQVEDYVVSAIEEKFRKIKKLIKDNELKGKGILRHRLVRKEVNELDFILSKRFGFRLKTIYAEKMIYGVLPTPPKNYNVLNTKINKNYDKAEAYLHKLRTKQHKKTEDINDIKEDEGALAYIWKKSIDDLTEQIEKDGIYVDLEKAVIHNMPKDYHCFIMTDLGYVFNRYDLEPLEITAILIHEIGHTFTHIENSIRTVKNTTVMMESIKESMSVGNRSPKETLYIAYEETIGKNRKDIESKNVITVTMKFVEKFALSSQSMSNNPRSSTDSEQLADQFASRFGLGLHLATALDKLINSTYCPDNGRRVSIATTISLVNLGVYVGILILLTNGGFMTVMATIMSSFVIFWIAIMVVGRILISALTNGLTSADMTYDYDERRVKRIKHDMIRRLRMLKMDDDVIAKLISDIENIDKIIDKMKNEDDSIMLVDKFFRQATPKGRLLISAIETDEMIEDLTENELHVVTAKLKQL